MLRRWALVVAAVLLPTVVQAQQVCDFYVATAGGGGSNANPGTIGSPWLTLDFAMDNTSAGADICVRGGTYGGLITATAGGSSGNRKWIKEYEGEVAILDFTGVDPTNGIPCVRISSDYWTVDGFEIRDCPRAGIGFNSEATNDLWILNNDIHDNGRTANENQGYGIMFTFNSTACYCRIENNLVYDNYSGGIGLLENDGGRYFLKDNTIYENDGCLNQDGISVVDTPYTIITGGRVNDGAESGSSCLGGDTQLADYIDLGSEGTCPDNNNHVLVEDVTVYRSSGSSTDETGMKIGGCQLDTIVRGLTIRNVGNNLHGYEQPFLRVAIYHNAFVADATLGQNNTWWHTLGDATPGGPWGSMHLANNAFISAGGEWTISFWGCCSGGVDVDDSAMRYEGNVYNFTGTTEVLWDSAGVTSPFSPTLTNFNTWRTQSGFEADTSRYSTDTLAQTFVDYANADYTPTTGTSDLIDAGEALTLANGAGSSSTSLFVDQWWYFKGDWGMSAIGEVADSIKIGSGACVSISSINEGTGAITLASARTWSDNDPVSWCPAGVAYAGAAPDAGAVESGVASDPGGAPFRLPRFRGDTFLVLPIVALVWGVRRRVTYR